MTIIIPNRTVNIINTPKIKKESTSVTRALVDLLIETYFRIPELEVRLNPVLIAIPCFKAFRAHKQKVSLSLLFSNHY